jgi:hypothetical protein
MGSRKKLIEKPFWKTTRSVAKAELRITSTQGKQARLFVMQRRGKPIAMDIVDLAKSPGKISFGAIQQNPNRLEFYAYPEDFPNKIFIGLNFDQSIGIDRIDFLKLLSLTMKSGRFLGVLGKRRRKRAKNL